VCVRACVCVHVCVRVCACVYVCEQYDLNAYKVVRQMGGSTGVCFTHRGSF